MALMAMIIFPVLLTSCQKNLSFENAGPFDDGSNPSNPSTPTVTTNSWTFTAAGHTYSGKVSSSVFTTALGGQLLIVGNMQSGASDTVMALGVQFPGSTLELGVYPSSDPGTNFALEKSPSGNIIFAANALYPPLLTITISAYDPSTKIISGTFSGNSYNISNAIVAISAGSFKAKLQ